MRMRHLSCLLLLFYYSSAVQCSNYKQGILPDLIKTLNDISAQGLLTCSDQEEDLLSPFGLTVTRNQKWPKKNITVCWAKKSDEQKICRTPGSFPEIEDDPSGNIELKDEIKQIISQEYSLEKTGIHFIGWNNCSESEHYDVMLFASSFLKAPLIEGAAGEACIGPCTNFSSNQTGKPYVILGMNPINGLKLGPLDDLRMTALHEFGHLSGLYHEHDNHPKVILSLQQSNETVIPTSKLDEFSVMNYNFNLKLRSNGLHFEQNKLDRIFSEESRTVRIKSISNQSEAVDIQIGLSAGDINALKCLYVYSDDLIKKNCNSQANP